MHSLSIVEKQDDSPSKFAVGTGPINSWDQYYVLEASSPEKKQAREGRGRRGEGREEGDKRGDERKVTDVHCTSYSIGDNLY